MNELIDVNIDKAPKRIDFIDDQGCIGVDDVKGGKMRLAIVCDPAKQKTKRSGDLEARDGIVIAVYEHIKNKQQCRRQSRIGRCGREPSCFSLL